MNPIHAICRMELRGSVKRQVQQAEQTLNVWTRKPGIRNALLTALLNPVKQVVLVPLGLVYIILHLPVNMQGSPSVGFVNARFQTGISVCRKKPKNINVRPTVIANMCIST